MLIKFKKNPLAGIAMHILVEANSHEWIFGGQTYLCANKFWYLVSKISMHTNIISPIRHCMVQWPNHIISILTKQLLFKRIVFKTFLCKDHFTHTAARILTWIEAFNRHIQSVQLYSIRSIRFRTKYKSWKQSHRVVNTNAVSNQILSFSKHLPNAPQYSDLWAFFATSPYVEMIC